MKLYLALLFLFPSVSFAYLDPGTGNALVYLLLTIGGAFIYFFKRIFYIIVGFFNPHYKETQSKKRKAQVTLYCEGITYWYTFKPIIEELINRKIYFRYLTNDIEDPGLKIYNTYMQSKYVGQGQSSYAKIGRSQGLFFVATTPNIGCKGYPLRRPKQIKTMIHVSHTVGDLSYLKQGSIDNYDVIMDIGNWCEERLRKIEQIRHLTPKKWLAVGLPYLDELEKTVKENKNESNGTPCILIAPSWGNKNSLIVHGTQYLFDLLNSGYKVILRPHPQSWHFDKELLDEILQKSSKYPNFILDKEIDANNSMSQADLLISDSSSFRFDFAFLYKRPVITMEVPLSDLSTFEAGLLGGPWEVNTVPKLGAVIKKGHDAELKTVIDKLLISNKDEIKKQINTLYDELVVNHGNSAKAIVDYMVKEGLN